MNNKIPGKSITIIGGGPSGMMAAISAARQGGCLVRIIEKNDFLGRKLLATGNGRCNLTNRNCEDAEKTLGLFMELGLLTREEQDGRIYPYSEQASAVQEVLISELKSLQVEIICSSEVKAIDKTKSGFQISFQGKTAKVMQADAVILTTGGKAGPQYGSTGDGYKMAKAFGHNIERPMPSLVQLVSELSIFQSLKGVRTKGQVTLLLQDEMIDSELGEIQFTEEGLSGICILNLSKQFIQEAVIKIDLLPEYSQTAVCELLVNRKESLCDRKLSDFFNGMINKKLGQVILCESSLDGDRRAESLSHEEITKLAHFMKDWKIPISGTKGWKEAQVTSGGVRLAEINPNTMESLLVPNMYFAGELLDVDEKCGGYNLQWAWSSGFTAGKSAAVTLMK